MEDKEDLIISKRNFASSMKIILGNFYLTIIGKSKKTKSIEIEEQIRNLMLYKLREERKGCDYVSIKKLVNIFGKSYYLFHLVF